MNRRHFLGSTLSAAVAAALPGSAIAALINSLTTVSSSITGRSGDGAEVTLEAAALEELKGALRGNLLLAGDPGYDVARKLLNPSFDKYPALVVQPSGAADVASAVTFAKERDLLVAVKCGGHSFSGKSTCNGGMQIDLSAMMRGCHVDRASKTAHVAGGSLLGDLDHECMAQGLVTPAGTVSHTGVGGLSLGGGFGRLARKYGLTLDNIRSVDIVTADGELRHASADENPDLFWGVRGGGGNFGVVTSFEFALHEMDRTVIAGDVVFPMDRAKDVFRFYADAMDAAPDELNMDLIMAAPPGNKPGVVLIHAVYPGDHGQAEKVLPPFAKLGEPLANTIGPKDYVALQKLWDDSDPRHGGNYIKGGFVTEIDDAQIDAIVDGFEGHPDRATTFFYQPSGGAINRVAEDATAFPNRNVVNGPAVVVSWNQGVDRQPHVDYIREYWSTVEKFTDGFYTNTGDFETQPDINRNYRGNYKRLVALKNQYDPTNLFRLNINVEPSKA